MSQRIPIYIPTYINNEQYSPARVLPRLFFYNGMIDCERYWIESGSATFGGVTYEQTAFPYFDNYNVVSGSFPTIDSNSLLFTNEGAVYGEVPTGSLYTNYWDTYISLLYNPKTRLINCSAIIPLAEYFQMELNDIVNFRGNYYHLRAINDYSLKTGECNLQLLGPIIGTTFTAQNANTPTTTAGPATTTTAGPTTTTTVGPTTTTTTSGPTTTTTSGPTTTTTTIAACNLYSLYLPSGVTVDFDYVLCGTNFSQSIAISANEEYTICIQGDKYERGTSVVVTNLGACTTTTIAPGSCQTWILNPDSTNVWFGNYVNCYGNAISGATVDSQDAPFDNQICAIGIPQRVSGGNLITSGSCVTTTTLAPGCSTFVITNNGTFFDFTGQYVYCGASVSSSYSVPTESTITLCVQDGKIDLPVGPNYVVNISGSCNSTTTTTTTLAPGCYLATIINNTSGFTFLGDYVYCGDNFSQSFSVSSGTSASFCTQDQKIDLPSGPNYTSSFSAVGGCNSTTTTTTTLAPGCYLATIVNNNIGTTWVGEYVYCGNNFSQSFSVASGTSASFCTQDQKIDLPPSASYYTSSFGPVGGCNSTTTTTTTLAPGCYLATIINNNIGTTFLGDYVYCGTSVSQSFSVASGTSASFCTQDQKIDLPSGPNYTSSFSAVGGCASTTTTTTTLAPGCYLATIINNNTGTTFVGEYVYCGNNFSSSFSVGSGTSGSFCTQDKKIDLPSGPNYTSSFSAVGGCTTSTTTTTTLPPAFSNIYTADAWFDKNGFNYTVNYTGSNGLLTSSVIS
jgi:hypothetical protein